MTTHAQDTRAALDAEVSGNHRKAIRLYGELMAQARHDQQQHHHNDSDSDGDDGDRLAGLAEVPAATPEEVALWRGRSLDCQRQLCDWPGLYDSTRAVALLTAPPAGPLGPAYGPDDEAFCVATEMACIVPGAPGAGDAERQRERLLPYYLAALLRRGPADHCCPAHGHGHGHAHGHGHGHGHAHAHAHAHARNQANSGEAGVFLSAALKEGSALRPTLEAAHATDLAHLYAARGDWARVRVHADRALGQFAEAWRALHPCAVDARRSLLQVLVLVLVRG